MQHDALLTQEELDFIQSMHRSSPQLNLRDVTSSLKFDGGLQVKKLFDRLVANERVTIHAQIENHQLTFPVQLVEDEFHALHLQLGAPDIYEDGPMARPWRLQMDHALPMENLRGHRMSLWVREISSHGVLMEVHNDVKPPQRFSLWFNPGDGSPRIPLRGTLQRQPKSGLAAYSLDQRDGNSMEKLRQYMLDQHRRAHPEVHA